MVEKALAVGYAEELGALLVVDDNGNYAACGADPVLIAAVANTPGGTDTGGYNILGHKEFPTGYMQGIAIRERIFRAFYVGALPAADGGAYGVVRDTDGFWKVDFNEVDNPVLTIVGRLTASPESQLEVLIKFIPARIQSI